MRKIILFFVFMSIICLLMANNRTTITLTDGTRFSGELLCSSDSLLYVWTGLQDFNPAQLEYVEAFHFMKIIDIKITHVLSWKQGIARILPVTLGASSALVIANFKGSDFLDIFFFMGILNLATAIPGGGLISLGSHLFTYHVEYPRPIDFEPETGKYHTCLLLEDDDDRPLIQKIIQEVQP